MNKAESRTIAYCDCFSGVSGDMFLGALLHAGLPAAFLLERLALLGLHDFQLHIREQQSGAIRACRVEVESCGVPGPRNYPGIQALIRNSSLAPGIKDRALTVFAVLARAEATVHGCAVEKVHFHEVGGVDAIVDIVGSAIGLDYFGIDHLICSPLPLTRGWVVCDHGPLPLPAPAVCEILKEVPVEGLVLDQELVTPTGAALVKGLSRAFGPFPAMSITGVGYGAGSRERPDGRPNLFRLVIGASRQVAEADEVQVIECNLDDWSPEGFPYLCELLFARGALDVTLTPVHMKKGRPGFLLMAMAPIPLAWEIKRCILSETTSLGVRYRNEQRLTLPRQIGRVESPWGPLLVKRAETPAGIVLYPEYEDCRRIALEHKTTLKEVYSAVARCTPADFMPLETEA